MTKIDKSFGDPSKSEDQKYLETLMADMGLQDLNDLSPSERKAYIDASKPTYKMKRKSSLLNYYNISKFGSVGASNVLILVHPDALMEQNSDLFEEYVEKIKSSVDRFDEVFIYFLFDINGLYVNRILERANDPEKLKKIYEDLLNLKSKKIHIEEDKDLLASSFSSDKMYLYFMNNSMNIFISGGFQDSCLRGACNNLFSKLGEHIKEFGHQVSIYKPLVYTSGKRDVENRVPQIGSLNYPSYETTYDDFFPKIEKNDSSGKTSWFDKINVVSEDDFEDKSLEKNAKRKNKDPKKGTGKKPKGSGRRLYTDENPKDTCSVSFTSASAIRKTFSTSCFKSKSHARQSQIINLVHQRVRAAYRNAKDPKVKKRLKKALEYAEKRKESSKKKTERLRSKKSYSDIHNLYKIASENISVEELINDAKDYNKPRKGQKKRWSTKYKKNINCNNPKGFSQKQYCKRKKRGGSYK